MSKESRLLLGSEAKQDFLVHLVLGSSKMKDDR